MADNKNNDNDSKNNGDGIDDSEEENEILEESPCGRWLKRREQVEQRDIPGIDATYLAMDTEEGVEVVWNEVRFSERKYFKTKEETINEVFDRLIQLNHPNIVKLHKYWVHKDVEKPRVVFITEYMSSGSLKQFLRKTKKNLIRMALNAWRRWCTQTLSALCYLHTSQPPIVHGNLNCDTIFISYNGLIKIGAVAPDAIHKHVKTVRGDSKANVHFIAPEIGSISDTEGTPLSPSVDIYSFGMCALEMAALEISPNGESSHITDDVIMTTIESLDNRLQKDFITKCLNKNPKERPSARELLFHPIVFEVPSLKLFSAHVIVNTSSFQPEQLTEEAIARTLCLQNSSDIVLAEILHNDSRPNVTLKLSDCPKVEFEKFFEEVRNGSFPLTAIVTTTRPPLISRQRTMSPEVSGDSTKQLNSPDNPYDEETRRVLSVTSTLEHCSETNLSDKRLVISLHIIFDDKINRKLSTKLEITELIPSLAQELVFYGFLNKEDHNIIMELLSEVKELFISSGNLSVSCQKSQQLTPQQPTQQSNTTQVLPQQSKQVVLQQQILAPMQPIQSPQSSKQQSIPFPMSQPMGQQKVQSIPQMVAPLTPQPMKQLTPRPIPQLTSQLIPQLTPRPIPQLTPQPIPQLTPQSILQSIPQMVVPLTPQIIPQPIPHSASQSIPQMVTPLTPQQIQQSTQQLRAQIIQPLLVEPIQQVIPQQVQQQTTPTQTKPNVISQPTVGPQSTAQQIIRTQIPAQTQTSTQTIPQQMRSPQQVSQQLTQPQTPQMSSVTSQTVGATPPTEKNESVDQRPVV